ncbi:RluA family pseudouridine synthase [Aggregicoccus sp. 17bor-14]|uniref:RluA family pseudouridine synthase n=1 Tax=Myxococcaceae TaxID=31 RepID=UPI00129D1A50|nr:MULTISPECIES: RluA family pseudouridine synthase [Myxococcaceae]MBF5043928.1 RluA family pseudouridine synthase [Simulacricoccus sp. 17bor-14]MRI89679.1 RluA family pseudouridine synthase [Aggregicoccus sp. 17bor-14]
MTIRKLTVTAENAGKRLDQFLMVALPGTALARARELITQGRVRIRGKQVKPLRRLWDGEEVEVDLPAPRALSQRAEGPRLPLLYEAPALVIVNKPSGYTVEPEGKAPSVVTLLASQMGGFDVGGQALPGVAHRLDRETTGCLALARTDAGLAQLQAAFQEKRVDKRYLTLVLGAPPDSARLEGPYARSPDNPRLFTTRVESARRAALTYEVRERFAGAALVEVNLETGRTHQIRVQLSEAGFPVLGDPLYGPLEARAHPAAQALGRLALHAARLRIEGLSAKGHIAVEASLPEDFQRALAVLRAP